MSWRLAFLPRTSLKLADGFHNFGVKSLCRQIAAGKVHVIPVGLPLLELNVWKNRQQALGYILEQIGNKEIQCYCVNLLSPLALRLGNYRI